MDALRRMMEGQVSASCGGGAAAAAARRSAQLAPPLIDIVSSRPLGQHSLDLLGAP